MDSLRILLMKIDIKKLKECILSYVEENMSIGDMSIPDSPNVVYPNPNEPVLSKKGDTYVPGLADKFMLAFDYYDKKTKKVLNISSRTGDSEYLRKLGISQPPIGWYMSEKFDGQRALWDGAKFVTRGSTTNYPRVYPYVPSWFVALMPPGVALDGEFFIKRNAFQEIGFLKSKLKPNLSNQSELDKKWGNIKYYVFDTPSVDLPFEERMDYLKKLVADRCKLFSKIKSQGITECPLIYTEQYLIESEEQLNKYYSELISNDAEGVMIRAPKVKYIPTRTRLILKLKPEEDSECTISGYKPGTGKYEGSLGSFECEMPNGKKFFVSGMSDSIRTEYINKKSEYYHPVGTVITYKYTFLTDDGIPRFPRYKGKRMEYNK